MPLIVNVTAAAAFMFLVFSGVAIQVASGAYALPVSKTHNIFGM